LSKYSFIIPHEKNKKKDKMREKLFKREKVGYNEKSEIKNRIKESMSV